MNVFEGPFVSLPWILNILCLEEETTNDNCHYGEEPGAQGQEHDKDNLLYAPSNFLCLYVCIVSLKKVTYVHFKNCKRVKLNLTIQTQQC